MAACGSLEHIFENPLPENQTLLESLSPIWNRINKPSSPTFEEIFRKLHFQENNDDGGGSGTNGATSIRSSPGITRKARTVSPDTLSLCTEGLGFESFDEAEDLAKNDDDRVVSSDNECREKNVRVIESHRRRNYNHCHHRHHRSSRSDLPPPISCIGQSGKPWVCFKSYREGGRFILKEIRIPTQEFLHACREDGRLRLHFVSSDDEIYDDDDDEDEEEDGGEAVSFPGGDMKDR